MTATSSAPARRRGPHDRASLLAVAVAEFNARGYDGTSMEDLARAAGITKSSFYHHVAGKEELLRAALERALDALFAILREPAAKEGVAVDRLHHIVRRQVEVLMDELPYVTLLLRVHGTSDAERWALGRRRTFDARVASLVAAAQADGDLDPGLDPGLAARLLSGTVSSMVEWYRPGRRDRRQLPERVVELVTHGILAPPPATSPRPSGKSTRPTRSTRPPTRTRSTRSDP